MLAQSGGIRTHSGDRAGLRTKGNQGVRRGQDSDNRQWEKDGQKHYRTEIVVNELVLLDGGGKREEPQNNEVEVNDSDLPF